MIDYFALFQQSRRPSLDLEKLKQTYHELARISHPDQSVSDESQASDFAALNEGFRILSEPKTRLRHLLELDGLATRSDTVPNTLGEMFLETGALIQEIDSSQQTSTSNALTKAIAHTKQIEQRRRLSDLLSKLRQLQADASDDLIELDKNWSSIKECAAEVSDLAARFSYLSRWIAQLEERDFRLANQE